MTKGKKSILLLFLSDLKANASENEYKYEEREEDTYTGMQTNDAPAKCLLKKAQEEGVLIEEIFYTELYDAIAEGGAQILEFRQFVNTVRQKKKKNQSFLIELQRAYQQKPNMKKPAERLQKIITEKYIKRMDVPIYGEV